MKDFADGTVDILSVTAVDTGSMDRKEGWICQRSAYGVVDFRGAPARVDLVGLLARRVG